MDESPSRAAGQDSRNALPIRIALGAVGFALWLGSSRMMAWDSWSGTSLFLPLLVGLLGGGFLGTALGGPRAPLWSWLARRRQQPKA